MRLSSFVLVLALTCIPVESKDAVKQLRGGKVPEKEVESKSPESQASEEAETVDPTATNAIGVPPPSQAVTQGETVDPPAPAAVETKTPPAAVGVPAKEVETKTPEEDETVDPPAPAADGVPAKEVETKTPEEGETVDPPAPAAVGVPAKESQASETADAPSARVPVGPADAEPVDGEWEWIDVSGMRGGPAPWEWGWGDIDEMRGQAPWEAVPYAYAMEGPPQPWEGDWDDIGPRILEMSWHGRAAGSSYSEQKDTAACRVWRFEEATRALCKDIAADCNF